MKAIIVVKVINHGSREIAICSNSSTQRCYSANI